MILKIFVILFFLQVLAVNKCQPAVCNPFSFSLREKRQSYFGTRSNNIQEDFYRRRRCLSSTLSLLWPQVVGPVEQGEIEEMSYSEVPKTPIEHYLDVLRKRARQEEGDRLMVRRYLKTLTEAQDRAYGYPPYRRSYKT